MKKPDHSAFNAVSDALSGCRNELIKTRQLPSHPLTEAFKESPRMLEHAVRDLWTKAETNVTKVTRTAARRSALISFYLSPHSIYHDPGDVAESSLSSRAAYKGAYTMRLRECNRVSYAWMEALDAACGIPVALAEGLNALSKAKDVSLGPWAERFGNVAGFLGIAATLCSVAARVPVILEREAEMRRIDALKKALNLENDRNPNTINNAFHVSLSEAKRQIASEDLARRRLFHELMGRYFAPGTGAVRVIRSAAQLGAVGEGPVKWGVLLLGAMLSRTGRGCEIVCGELERSYTRDFAASPAGEAGVLTEKEALSSTKDVTLLIRQAAAAEYGMIAAAAARQRETSDPQTLAAEALRRVNPPRLGESPALIIEKAERALRLTPSRLKELRRVAQNASGQEIREATFDAISQAEAWSMREDAPAVRSELQNSPYLAPALNRAMGRAFSEHECGVDGSWSERKSGQFWRAARPFERREFCLGLIEAEFTRRRQEASGDLRRKLTDVYGKAFAEAEKAARNEAETDRFHPMRHDQGSNHSFRR